VSITVKSGGSIRNYLKPSVRDSGRRRRNRCCGAIDELISQMGFARSICSDGEVRGRIKALQMHLYRVGAVVAAPPGAKKLAKDISPALMDSLEAEINRVRSVPGVLRDGSLFWELPAPAALDIARTISRRAERDARRLMDKGELSDKFIPLYLNRLTDLLWLLGRLIESRWSIDS
jgi:cob(I)alamin adenosyltransferase